MREYTVVFERGFKVGLRHSRDNPRNEQALIQSTGVFHSKGKMIGVTDISTIDFSALGCTWPFPQMFQLKNYTLVCTPTLIHTYDGSSLTLVHTAEEGSTWTVADFYRFLVMTNGRELVTLNPRTGAWTKYLDCAVPYCLCVCELNGQLFVGGPEVTVSAGFLG